MIIKSLAVVGLCLASLAANAQRTLPIGCDYMGAPTGDAFTTQYSNYGLCHTPKGNLNILVIFIGFNGTTSADDQPGWLHNQIPDWASGSDNLIFNSTELTIGNFVNLSYFYKQMSLSQFTVTATVFPQQVMINQSGSFSTMGQSVRDWLNTNYPNYNWGQFDSRTNNSNWVTDNSTSSSDGNIDYTVFVYRDLFGGGYSGGAGLYSSNLNLVTTYGGGGTFVTAGSSAGDPARI